jgi:hypothetical protein
MSPSVGQGILEAAKLDLGMHGTPCLSGLSGFRDLLGAFSATQRNSAEVPAPCDFSTSSLEAWWVCRLDDVASIAFETLNFRWRGSSSELP